MKEINLSAAFVDDSGFQKAEMIMALAEILKKFAPYLKDGHGFALKLDGEDASIVGLTNSKT